MNSGIYKITNTLNGHTYIGSSKNIEKRFTRHKTDLRRKIHPNKHLQRAWDKYGEQSFQFEVIEYADVRTILSKEQYYLDTFKPDYNMCPIARSVLGIRRSDETRRKLSEALTGKTASPEARLKMSLAKLGVGRPMTALHKERISRALTGKVRTLASRKAQSDTMKGRPWTQARRDAQNKRKEKVHE